jgi:hypothetical protein
LSAITITSVTSILPVTVNATITVLATTTAVETATATALLTTTTTATTTAHAITTTTVLETSTKNVISSTTRTVIATTTEIGFGLFGFKTHTVTTTPPAITLPPVTITTAAREVPITVTKTLTNAFDRLFGVNAATTTTTFPKTGVLDGLFGNMASQTPARVLGDLFGNMVKATSVPQQTPTSGLFGGLFGNRMAATTVTVIATAPTTTTSDLLSMLGNPELEYVYRVIQVIFPQQTDDEKRKFALLIYSLLQAAKNSQNNHKRFLLI